MSVVFFVPGIPVAKGSARAFVVKGRAIVTQTNRDKQKPWASMIGLIASERGIKPVSGPVYINMEFVLPRPKSHYRSNGELKADVPTFHCNKPDADKLARCVLDALTGIAWHDDSQVHIGMAIKVYTVTSGPGALIEINQMWEGAQ